MYVYTPERFILYCRTTSASTAPRTSRRKCCHCASYCAALASIFPDGFDLHLLPFPRCLGPFAFWAFRRFRRSCPFTPLPVSVLPSESGSENESESERGSKSESERDSERESESELESESESEHSSAPSSRSGGGDRSYKESLLCSATGVLPPNPRPLWRQPRGKSMVSLVNFHTNATRIRWHLWEIDLRFAPRVTSRVAMNPAPTQAIVSRVRRLARV